MTGPLEANPYALPLAQLDVSNPWLYQQDLIGPYFERLRREAPVHYCENGAYGAFWSITRYDDIVAVNANDKAFSCDYQLGGHVLGYEKMFRANGVDARMFQSTDAPIHTAQRKAIAPVVARASVREMEDMIRARCGALLDTLPVGETFDWVDRLSVELTSQVLAELFDFPWEKRRLLSYWSDIAVTEPGYGIVQSWDERREGLEDCFNTFAGLWQERLQGEPRSDLLSLMVHAEGTKNLSPGEFLGNLINLIVGGNDTTRNSMSGLVEAFNRFDGEWAKLEADNSLISNTISEVLRWQTPLAHMRRTAVEDADIAGVPVKKGDKIVVWYISGNRDESLFPDAETFDITRANARRHLSFGFGVHRCVGARLAELQIAVLLEELLARKLFPRQVGAAEYVAQCFVHGFRKLPVVLERR